MENLWNNSEIVKLWKSWNSLQFSKLLLVNQMSERNIIIEFAINSDSTISQKLLSNLKEITIKKIPSGNISFISYLSQFSNNNYYINTQFKRYRIDFIDPVVKYKEEDIKEKSILYYNELLSILTKFIIKK